MLQALISFNYIYVTVLYIYRKHCRIVRYSIENAMMHVLDGLLISLIHNNVPCVDFFINYFVLYFLYSYEIQWNPAITKCQGTEKNVRFSEVFVIAKTPPLLRIIWLIAKTFVMAG